MSKLRKLEELPADEKEYFERHVRDIPLNWDPTRIRKLLVPTRYKWYEQPAPFGESIQPPEYVTFEYMKVGVGKEPFIHTGLALVANNDVFVWWI